MKKKLTIVLTETQTKKLVNHLIKEGQNAKSNPPKEELKKIQTTKAFSYE